MKNKLLIGLILLFFSNCSSQNVSQKKETIPLKTSMLWKIEGNGLKKPSYLFGSMHLIEKKYFQFSDTLKNYILNSDQIIMEMSGMPDYASVMPKLMLPEGESLSDYFRPGQLDTLLNWMEKELSIPKEMYEATFSKMKPFVLLEMLATKEFKGETESYDMTIMNLVAEKSRKIIGFETIDQQLGFFDSIPTQTIINMVYQSIENMDSITISSNEMQRVYANRDLDSLGIIINENPDDLMGSQDLLLDNRNADWSKQLDKLLPHHTTFIAVGAGHLIGEKGLIELLRKKGYKVTPIAY